MDLTVETSKNNNPPLQRGSLRSTSKYVVARSLRWWLNMTLQRANHNEELCSSFLSKESKVPLC